MCSHTLSRFVWIKVKFARLCPDGSCSTMACGVRSWSTRPQSAENCTSASSSGEAPWKPSISPAFFNERADGAEMALPHPVASHGSST